MQNGQQPDRERHTMRYSGTRSDYHEFLCDTCGRHLLFHMNPSEAEDKARTFVVLKQGDLRASHSGGIGGLTISDVDVSQSGGNEEEPDWEKVKASLDDVVDEILNGKDD